MILCLFLLAAPALQAAEADLTQNLPENHARRMKTMLYDGAVGLGQWVDGLPATVPFLHEIAFWKVTWMRLIASLLIVTVAGLLGGLLSREIRLRAGKLDTDYQQSWLQIVFAALRKPFALLVWLAGGFFAIGLLIDLLEQDSTRWLLFAITTTIAYAARVLILFWLIFRLLTGVKKRIRIWAEKRGGVLETVLLPTIAQALRFFVPLIAFIVLQPLMSLPADWAWVTRQIVSVTLIVGLASLLIRGAHLTEQALLRTHRIDSPDNLLARKIYTRTSVIRQIFVVFVILLGVSAVLMLFEPLRRLGGSILASAGIAGIVLGFAAQRVLGNFLAGIQIALTQPILIDDVVIVEGEWGRIEEINLTYVVIRIWDLRRLVVPITFFVEKPFQNWTRKSATILGTVFLYVDYDAPIEELRIELRRLCEEHKESGLWDGDVCGLQVTESKDRVLELRCLASSPDAAKSFDLRCEIREKMVYFLREKYPQSLPRLRAEFNQVVEKPDAIAPLPKRGKNVAKEKGDALPGMRAVTKSKPRTRRSPS